MDLGVVLVTRGIATLERHPGRVCAVIGAVFAVAYLTAALGFPPSHGRLVNGDTIQYYSYLRSIVFDRDVDFTNEYAVLYSPLTEDPTSNVWLVRKTAIGRPINMMSIGPALLWMPLYLAVLAGVSVLRPSGVGVTVHGYEPLLLVTPGVAGIAFATLGAYFCYRACRLIFPQRVAFWATLVAWLATSAVYYSVVAPAYSHAPSFFAVSAFVFFWMRTRETHAVRRYVTLGLLAGLAALVRWQDIIVLVLPAFELARAVSTRRTRWSSAAGSLALTAAVAGLALLPQLLAWKGIYGEFVLMPQGAGFMQWTHPRIVSVLLSLRHGLLTWTPAVTLALAGMWFLMKKDPLVGGAALVVMALAVYVNASVHDWWAGAAFGARRFVSYSVFFALGLAALLDRPFWTRRPALPAIGSAALIVYNLLFVLQYQLFMRGFEQVGYPTTAAQVFFERLILPWRLIVRWLG